VFLENDLHDVDSVDVVEEHRQVVCHGSYNLIQVGSFAVLEDELQQLFLDDILLKCTQVGIYLFEEVGLFWLTCCVDLPELNQRLVQLYSVQVVLDLFVHVLKGQETVDKLVVLFFCNLLEVHLDQDDSLVILA